MLRALKKSKGLVYFEKYLNSFISTILGEKRYSKIKSYFLFKLVKKEVKPKQIKDYLKNLYPYKTNVNLIRIGSSGDGGYLVPDDFKGVVAIFSPGVSTNWSFEENCLLKGIKKAYLADGSVNPKIDNNQINFLNKFIGKSKSKNFITLENWIKENKIPKNKDLMLQMDIEGWEYNVIETTSVNTLKQFRIILIEFHDLQFLPEKAFFNKFRRVMDKLLENHYVLHIHPNNMGYTKKYGNLNLNPVLEFTFLRKDRVKFKEFETKFPHSMDVKNIKNNPGVNLSKDFYFNS